LKNKLKWRCSREELRFKVMTLAIRMDLVDTYVLTRVTKMRVGKKRKNDGGDANFFITGYGDARSAGICEWSRILSIRTSWNSREISLALALGR
jgi:hypothetical protein